MNLISNRDWLVIGFASMGAIWIALIMTGIFSVVFQYFYSKIKGFNIPDTIPEMWPD